MKTVILSDDSAFEPDEVTVGDDEDVFDSLVLHPDFDRLVLVRNRAHLATVRTQVVANRLLRLLSTATTDRPRYVVMLLHANDPFDEAACVSGDFCCVHCSATVLCRTSPPSFPANMAEWSLGSVSVWRTEKTADARGFSDGCSAIVMRYGNDVTMQRAKEQVLRSTEGPENPLQFVKRVVGETMSFPADASSTLTCKLFCDTAATLSRPLAPFGVASRNGTVSIRGVSRPIDWDVELPQVMRATSIAPHTHAWAFDGQGNMSSLFNNSEADARVHDLPVKRLFFFPNMRAWLLVDAATLFSEGVHEDVRLAVTPATVVQLGNCVVSMRCEFVGGITMTWNCNQRFHNAVPERVMGSVITRIEVSRV